MNTGELILTVYVAGAFFTGLLLLVLFIKDMKSNGASNTGEPGEDAVIAMFVALIWPLMLPVVISFEINNMRKSQSASKR